ncbi:MAG: hypothetical protein BGO49_14180 [Planctomycetales bacterium 71-10]|nr:MAG: hypothetical protein BGO49_14180 [Planctomycetales bacterium 71-10]
MSLDIDDPRLTAFALGELPEAERPDIEQALADHPELAREVEQIRLTARWLSEQLHEEQAREAAAAASPLRLVADVPRKPWFRRPASWLSAAAAVLVLGVSATLLMPRYQAAREEPAARYARWFKTDVASDKAVASAPAPAPAAEPALVAAASPDVLRDQLAGTSPVVVGTQGGGLYNFDDSPSQAAPKAGTVVTRQRRMLDPAQSQAPAPPAAVAANAPDARFAAPQVRALGRGVEQLAARSPQGRQEAQGQGQQQGSQGQQQGGPPGQGQGSSVGMNGMAQMGQSGGRPMMNGMMAGMMGEGRNAGGMGGMRGRPARGDLAAGPSSADRGAINSFGTLDDRQLAAGASQSQGQGRGLELGQSLPQLSEAKPGQMAQKSGDPAQPTDSKAFTHYSDRNVSDLAKAPEAAGAVPAADAPVALALKEKGESRPAILDGAVSAMKSVDKLGEAEVAREVAQPEARFGLELKDAEAVKPEPVSEPAPAPAVEENPFVLTSQEAASTFAIDVDTASYSIVRRSLMEQNRLPSPGEVRIEEMLNYFPYQDALPPAGSPDPFAIHVEPARCPWNAANRLARIGIMGRPLGQEARKPSNLVFLVDVSGSMDQPNKLPLVQWGLQKLVEQLGENDRVAIAVYAGSSGLVLPSTSAMNKPAILSKIEELRAGGSTNGGAGIQLAYDQAAAGFINGGINRVILATDGDFNVGVTNQDELVTLVGSKAKGEKPIFLTVLGFGMDNLKDGTLEKLADKGNGHYAYIDRPEEAYKVLVEEMGATLDVIAKDVKIQVEFKPELVRAYRLIGYENRVMPNQDFRNDQKDGGEIGAGHHVTALYEYVPAEAAPAPPADGGPSPASFTVRLRYKQPQGDVATEIERPVVDRGVDYADASDDLKFASAVAGFGMILRRSPSVGSLTLPGVLELASPTLAHDPGGYRREFLALVQRARDIQAPPIAAPANP